MYILIQLHCCGFNNYSDYDQSSWRSMASNHNQLVPYTCCSTTPISHLLFRKTNVTQASYDDLDVDIHDHHDEHGDHDHDDSSSTESFHAAASTQTSWLKRCQSVNPMESDDYLYAQVSIHCVRAFF